MHYSRHRICMTALGCMALMNASAQAQTGADFFKGKTVTYIVATAAGGGYDVYGRLIAEYMQKHLPGSTFVVKNIPGAGHVVGTNTLYASKPDGLTIGTFNTGLIFSQLLSMDGVKFDLPKMSWIGKAASDPMVFLVGSQSNIHQFDDLRTQKEPVNFATGGLGTANYTATIALATTLNLPVRILTGYNGNEDLLAIRRGEVVGLSASRSSAESFVNSGYGRYIAQIGGSQTDVPQLKKIIREPNGLSVAAVIESQADISRLTAGPPGIPADRLAALRDAYRKALEDKELQEKAEKAKLPLDPSYGEDVSNLVKAALNQKPEIVAILKSAMEQPAGDAAIAKATISAWDGRAKIKFEAVDGKQLDLSISGSRTEITVAGQKAGRDTLKVGMKCDVAGRAGGEATKLSCE